MLVSRVVTDLVAGAGLRFAERGSHELKGLPGRFDLYTAGAEPGARPPAQYIANHLGAGDCQDDTQSPQDHCRPPVHSSVVPTIAPNATAPI